MTRGCRECGECSSAERAHSSRLERPAACNEPLLGVVARWLVSLAVCARERCVCDALLCVSVPAGLGTCRRRAL